MKLNQCEATSASRSQPSGNTKKDKIQQTPSSTQKNKVEAHHRKVKSSLKNKDCVVAPKGTANVQHSKLNANSKLKCVKCNGLGNACPLTRVTTTTEVPLRKLTVLDNEIPKPVIGNVTISRVYYVEGLGHNLFSVGKFYDSNLIVAFRQHICFIRNLEGVDLLTGSRGNNLYILSLGDMMASSPICLLSKASKTKSWLWHRRLSHLNFGVINHLARHGLVRGLLKLKFEKDHLCSACAMGKIKKKPHKPKSEDTNQEKLYLFHMDLCRPMRVAGVNGKKYILIIVDDYSRFTWVKCLRSKDETLDFIIKFLKMIQVRLKVPVQRIRTDNGNEYVNQTLREYYEKVGISHETSVARSSQQNGVFERRLVPNPPPSTLFVPPSRTVWDMLFQPLFDELLNPPPSVDHPAPEVVAPIDEVAAPVPAEIEGDTQPPVIPNDVEEDNHDIKVAHMGNDPYFGIPIPEVPSDQSSSSDSIHTNVPPDHQISEHNNK
ncbi:retrovirus-related pol polyprotein from transposon TNT 1-94 [Tanacetum coccineum]